MYYVHCRMGTVYFFFLSVFLYKIVKSTVYIDKSMIKIIKIYKITRIVRALWLAKNLWFIVPVNS